MSEPEIRLWSYLGGFDVKFRRQEPIGRYIVDFCCCEARLVVEVDGEQHAAAVDYDDMRDGYLASLGFKTVRVWAYDVMADIDGVLRLIGEEIEQRISGDL